jgi:hypothetical protein
VQRFEHLLKGELFYILECKKNNRKPSLEPSELFLFPDVQIFEEMTVRLSTLFKIIAQHGQIERFAKTTHTRDKCHMRRALYKLLNKKGLINIGITTFNDLLKVADADGEGFRFLQCSALFKNHL